MNNSFKYLQNYAPYFILLLFAFLYFNTLFPGVGGRVTFGDSAKFQYLWAINGTPHSTGYPQMLMITKIFGNLFTFLAPYNRIVIISTLFSLGTLFFVYKISKEIIVHPIVNLLPMLILGTASVYWSQSTETEVYTLNSFYVSAVAFLVIRFAKTKKIKYLQYTIVLYCLSFGNHLTMITMLPALVYIVFITDSKVIFNKKILVTALFSVILGASQYLYVWWLSYQGSPVLEYIGENASFSRFLNYITGREHEGKMGENISAKYLYQDAMFQFLDELWKNVGWAVLVFAVSFFFIKKQKTNTEQKILNFIGIAFLTHFVFVLFYQITDIRVYYIPLFLYLGLFVSKSIDLISIKSARFSLIIFGFIFSAVFIIINFNAMKKVNFSPYFNSKTWVNEVPENANLYTSYDLFHDYHGQQTINYMRYLENDKNLNFINRLDTSHLEKEIYVPQNYLQEPLLNRFYEKDSLVKAITLLDFLKNNKENTIIISAKDDAKNGLSSETKKQLERLGLNFNTLHFRGSYTAILEKGKVVFEKINNEGNVYTTHDPIFKKYKIKKLASAGNKFGNYSAIVIDGKEYSQNLRGLNIAVINSTTNEIQPYYFDTFESENMTPIVVKMKLKKIMIQ